MAPRAPPRPPVLRLSQAGVLGGGGARPAKAGPRPRWNIPGAGCSGHPHLDVLVSGAGPQPLAGRELGNLAAAGPSRRWVGPYLESREEGPPPTCPGPAVYSQLPHGEVSSPLSFPVLGSLVLPGTAAPPSLPPSTHLREGPLLSPCTRHTHAQAVEIPCVGFLSLSGVGCGGIYATPLCLTKCRDSCHSCHPSAPPRARQCARPHLERALRTFCVASLWFGRGKPHSQNPRVPVRCWPGQPAYCIGLSASGSGRTLPKST